MTIQQVAYYVFVIDLKRMLKLSDWIKFDKNYIVIENELKLKIMKFLLHSFLINFYSTTTTHLMKHY